MDEYVGCIRQRVLERMDLSREMSDEEIENLIGEEASRLMQEEPISIRERLMLEARVFNSLRKLDALQELLDDPEISVQKQSIRQRNHICRRSAVCPDHRQCCKRQETKCQETGDEADPGCMGQ